MRRRTLCLTIVAGCLSASSLGAQARWSLVENLRIGSEEDGPYLFTQIRGIAVGERGSIFVLDFRSQEIRLFDRDGKFIKRVARSGSGPGEIRQANGFLTAPDGRVWVNDPSNGRLTVFTPDGDFSAQHLVSPWGFGYLWQGVFDRTGTLHEYVSVAAGDQQRQARIRRVSADGMKIDTVPLPACVYRGPKEAEGAYVGRSGRSSFAYGVPFVARPLNAWDGNGFIWCSSNDRYEILKLRIAGGDTVLRLTSSRQPIRVTEAERDAAIIPIRSAFARIGQPPPDFSYIPGVKPVLEAIDVDNIGRVWVRATSTDTTKTVFDLWDGNTGRQLATVTSPWRIGGGWRPLIRGDTLFTTIFDENEVPTVVRAVIRK